VQAPLVLLELGDELGCHGVVASTILQALGLRFAILAVGVSACWPLLWL